MTIYRTTPPGQTLVDLLRGAHDAGELELSVVYDAPALIVLRADNSDLSATEQREVHALLAADNAECFG